MPSPFPGMDPYLEDPVFFPGLHSFLITGLAAALNGVLPPSYVALVQERLYGSIYPDISVIQRSEPPRTTNGRAKAAVALASDPAWEIEAESDEIREGYIDIVAADDESRVVTTIEILSPTNRATGSEGRKQYEKKQREVLGSPTSMMEIDLLRSGSHTVAAPHANLARRGHYDYLMCLSRGERHGRFTVWAPTVREKLPKLLVPLAGDDADLVVDLQPVFDRSYDEGAFARRLDYGAPPTVALSPSDAEWAEGVLREAGLRR